MSNTPAMPGQIKVESQGSVWIARLDGGPHGLMGLNMAEELATLLDRVENNAAVDAVVFTGTHPRRFIGHADVRWLQEGGASIPKLGRATSSAVARTSKAVRGAPGLEALARLTPLDAACNSTNCMTRSCG